MRVGILGSGLMGGKLGTIFARAGHDVVFSYARTPQKLKRLAAKAGKHACAGTPAEAVKDADVVLVAVHWARVDDVLAEAGNLSGKVLMTCSLPMNADESELVLGHSTSGAEALAAKVPGAHVVSAFGTVPGEVLFCVFDARKRKTRPDLVYCGDDRRAKAKVARLIADAGFNPMDVGPLSLARHTEPFTLLIARIAYEGKSGPQLAYRFEHFRKAPRHAR
jgi:hypothetical protein